MPLCDVFQISNYIVSFGLAQTTSFRGHPLIGEKINVNENFTGLVISETKISITEIQQKPMLVNNTFKQINYWNWDYIPSSNDPVPQAMEWLSLSEVVILTLKFISFHYLHCLLK